MLIATATKNERDRIYKGIDFLIEKHICSKYALKYDRLSPELFKLNRTIPYIYGKEEIDIKIPLLASIYFDEDKDWTYEFNPNLGSYERIKITSQRPIMQRKTQKKARIAIADYHQTFVDALREPVIGDLLMNDLSKYKEKINFSMQIFWIPKPSELNIEIEYDKDPILVGKINNTPYLIDRWNIDYEEPIEYYIREFSEGKLKI